MPPMFYDLELEPWMSGEQAASSHSRAFQQEESGPSVQRAVYPEILVDRRRVHASNRVQGDANHLQPSKRKQVNGGSSTPEQSAAKKQKNLTETELAVIKLAASILDIPITTLLATQPERAERSEGSTTTYDSLEAPSTGPERADGYDLAAEPTGHPRHRQQPAPTSAPAFQPVGGFDGSAPAGYPEPPTFRDELDINSKNHLEWWGLNPGLVLDDFDASTSGGPQAGSHTRQEPSSQVNDWGHGEIGDTILTSEPVISSQPAWSSVPHGLSHGYHHEAAPPHRVQNQPPQNAIHFGPVPPPQSLGHFNYGARGRNDTKAAKMGSAITELDSGGNSLGTTCGNQAIPQTNQSQGNDTQAQAYVAKRPRPSRRVNHGEGARNPGRRGPLTEVQRLEACLTRKKGACIRCQRQAIKCKRDPLNPDGPCITCREVYGGAMTNLPCLRYKIYDAQLLDKDIHPKFIWSRRWTSMKIVEIEEWATPEIKTITVTQDVEGLTYDLQVREFVPVKGDSLFRAWRTNGVERRHAVTNYAIAHMAQTGLEFAAFAEKNIGKFIKFYINRSDKLMWSTYCMAYKYSFDVERKEERELLRNALKLWVGSRMESRRERICSAEVLGMQPQNWDFEADNFGAYLIPPVLEAQIELITTAHVLLPMRMEVLKGLQKLMKANLSRSWFSIYLCMFLLMHSCALLTKAESIRAKREPWGSDTRPQPRYYNPRLVEELHMGANILLGHFHYCNKGSHPFHMDWRGADESNTIFAGLAKEQISYMQIATGEVKRRIPRFQMVKEQKLFEDDYYFVSQLYEKDWVPKKTI